MHGFPQPEDPPTTPNLAGTAPLAGDRNARRALEEPELEAALQLLVERAQYITGATGAALALPHADEMVCRASAGSCAPAVGARLQVRSGLTGESIARRQLLRCDNAEADRRVNLETCRALGIASIVVLPLLRANGEVRGLFELFSDHPYAFEERDLIALERMAGLIVTALDLAEQRHGSIPPPARQPGMPTAPAESVAQQTAVTIPQPVAAMPSPVLTSPSESATPQTPVAESALIAAALPTIESPIPFPAVPPTAQSAEPPQAFLPELVLASEAAPAPLPESMLRVRKCASCGFPISEGRTLCLDCEKKEGAGNASSSRDASVTLAPAEDLPPFLANAVSAKESWLANHVNLLAILVLIVGILVAVVVFR